MLRRLAVSARLLITERAADFGEACMGCRLHAVLARDSAFQQCRGEPGASAKAAEAESAAMRSAMTRTFSVRLPPQQRGAAGPGWAAPRLQAAAPPCLRAELVAHALRSSLSATPLRRSLCQVKVCCTHLQVVDGEILDRARAEDGRDGSTGWWSCARVRVLHSITAR